jgi:hypothetical protein
MTESLCVPRAIRLTMESGTTVEFSVVMVIDQARLLNQVHGNSLDEIQMIQEYMVVLPKEFPGMPLDRDIEFIIDLLPGTPPISKRPYRMPINELVELKKQIVELESKGFIHPSTSPWGAPMLFIEKKDGTQQMCMTVDL